MYLFVRNPSGKQITHMKKESAPDRLEFVLRKLYQLQTIRIHIGRTKANKFPLAER